MLHGPSTWIKGRIRPGAESLGPLCRDVITPRARCSNRGSLWAPCVDLLVGYERSTRRSTDCLWQAPERGYAQLPRPVPLSPGPAAEVHGGGQSTGPWLPAIGGVVEARFACWP
jgi:hypothetical protein